MSRENGVLLASLMVSAAFAAAFVYWYWSPQFSFGPFNQNAVPHVNVNIANAEGVATPVTRSVVPANAPAPAATPLAELAPFCQPGQSARFVQGFAKMKERLGDVMGQPIECEHVNPRNGDTLQQTTTGLAVYTQRDGLQFTDGWRHWALEGAQLATWEGERVDVASVN